MTSRNSSRPFGLTSLAAAITLLSAFGLAACNRAEEPRTAGQQVDVAVGKAKEAAEQARAATEQVAAGAKTAITDATITAAVKAELARDSELSALSINVDTTEGRVALRGTAPNAIARDRATRLAAAVEGVRKVENQLTVKSNG
ncbi:MAG: BON domain-containing protein [Rubrivivax sp.]|nr:BON domain-containing protein [Rubrivivax sp.]